MNTLSVSFTTRVTGVAGPAAFQRRFAEELERRKGVVGWNLHERSRAPILVIGGSRDLLGLRRARREGRRVVQRHEPDRAAT